MLSSSVRDPAGEAQKLVTGRIGGSRVANWKETKMARLAHSYVEKADLKRIATRILADRLHRFGFKSVAIIEEEDFDGSPVVRLNADVDVIVPAKDLIAATTEATKALQQEGDDRYVYLRAVPQDADFADAEE
jgi:phosphoribosylformylglycinamidine (FGAM) synthase PurS component